jgi:hypothetical protein
LEILEGNKDKCKRVTFAVGSSALLLPTIRYMYVV